MKREDTAPKKVSEIFVARQPIFTKQQKVYGYELLFRSNRDNYFDQTINQDFASSKTLVDSFLLFGINELTREKRAFINLTEENLLKDYISAVPNKDVVVELLETIEPTPQAVSICKKLKNQGYIIALDDFVFQEKFQPLIDIADIIKVDFVETKGEERRHIIRDVGAKHVKFLAEKVETLDEFHQAVDAGYSYFQGYFFCKPVILSRQDLPSSKLILLQLLKELVHPNLNMERVENIMKHDVSLSYKLLRFINSASFGFYNSIRSIRHAVNLVGLEEFKKWMSVIIMSQIGTDKPDELMQQAVIRAKFCEQVADQTPLLNRKSDAFLMGMFSLIDTLVGRPMEDVLVSLPLADEIKRALLGEPNEFRRILNLITNYERGLWAPAANISKRIDFPMSVVPQFYMDAVKWAGCISID